MCLTFCLLKRLAPDVSSSFQINELFLYLIKKLNYSNMSVWNISLAMERKSLYSYRGICILGKQ